jgi:formate hydrogenlyase subunit 6/NADH:ubiquinone oxidoreductase subunit I
MKLDENGIIAIDYEKCIRCYCCQEVCPVDAISFSKGLVLRALDFLKI